MSKLKKFISDKNGQWAHPGKNTLIPDVNGRITMQGVPYPVYGIDDQGYAMMMMPGGEYQFPGNDVYEIPMAQTGLQMGPRREYVGPTPIVKTNLTPEQVKQKNLQYQLAKQAARIAEKQNRFTTLSGWAPAEDDTTLENAFEIIDPTGMLSWDDAEAAYNDPNMSNLEKYFNYLGAIPAAGKARYLESVLGLAGFINDEGKKINASPAMIKQMGGDPSIPDLSNKGWLSKYQPGGSTEPFLPWHGNYRRPTVIKDNRKVNATSGKPINPNKDLKSGEYDTQLIEDITKAAKYYGLDANELLAVALQETNLGKADWNVGHVIDAPIQTQYILSNPGNRTERGQFNLYRNQIINPDVQDMAAAYKKKMDEAKANNVTDPAMQIQYYNGLGMVYPKTERDYHKFDMSSIYGVPLTPEGISMKENPLYGKRILDLKENVLMADPTLQKYIQDTYNSYTPQAKDRDSFKAFEQAPLLTNKYGGWLQKYQGDEGSSQVGPRIANLPAQPTRQVNVGPTPNLGPTAEQTRAKEKAAEIYKKTNAPEPKKAPKTINAAELRDIDRELRTINRATEVAESTDTPATRDVQKGDVKSFEEFKQNKPDIVPNRLTMPDFSSNISSYQDPEERAKRELRTKYYKEYKPETKEDVTQIQQKLIADGYLDNKKNADGSYKEADGKFGDRTKAAYDAYLTKSLAKPGLDLSNELTRTECGLEGCAQYVSEVTRPYGWALGDAWTMNDYINNHGGKTKYNIYTDPAFRNVKTGDQLKTVTKQVKSKNKASADMFAVGDVIGIFYPPSSHHQEALDDGKGTYNTHVGVVTAIKDGVPVVSHNIHGTLHHDPYNSLNVGWISSPTTSDKVYKPSQRADTVEDKINVYAKDLAGVFAPDMDPDDVARTVKGILTKETHLGKTPATHQDLRQAVRSARGESTDPSDISRGIGKLKTSGLPADVKGFLQISDSEDLTDDAGIKGAVYKYIEGYKVFDDYRKKNPKLGLTDEDVRNMSILSYNQGYDKLSKLGYNKASMTPEEEVAALRKLYTGNVKDVTSTNYKYIPDINIDVGGYRKKIDVGQMLYDREYPEGHPSYIKKVNEYSKRKYGGWLDKYQGNIGSSQVPNKYDLMQMDKPTAVAESINGVVPNMITGPKQVATVQQEAQRLAEKKKELKAKYPKVSIESEEDIYDREKQNNNTAPSNFSKRVQVPGVSGSMVTAYVDPKTGKQWMSPSAQATQNASSEIARGNNIDPIGLGVLTASGAGPLVRTATAAMPLLDAPAVLPYIGEVPWLTAKSVMTAGSAGNSINQIVNPNSALRTDPNAENIAKTVKGLIGLPFGAARGSLLDDFANAGKYLMPGAAAAQKKKGGSTTKNQYINNVPLKPNSWLNKYQ